MKEILAEIITIGDEILIGQIVDTNSAWLGEKLNKIGIKIKQISSVSDHKEHIINALNEATHRADVILLTGGLGPTKDDITKNTLCEYFNTHLIFNDEIYKNIAAYFQKRNREVTELNRKQAEVPENCTPVINKRGTAAGMWFEQNNKVFVSMPGVPYEMKTMMEDDILSMLKNRFKLPFIAHSTLLTYGIGESALAEKIGTWEDNLAEFNLKLAYLPSPGLVKLRLSINSEDEKKGLEILKTKQAELMKLVEKYVYGFNEDTPEQLLGKKLVELNASVSCAESCSGGAVAKKITRIPGSSAYFMGGIVAYDNQIKTSLLNVNAETIAKYGAVSEQTVMELAKNCRVVLNTDFAIATTGIAGPTGGTSEKPIGTVWIAVASKDKVIAQKHLLGFDREINIEVTSSYALHMLLKMLNENQ